FCRKVRGSPVPCLTASCLPNGNDANDLALHFNPRFHDNIVLKLAGDVFEVEITDDHEFKFPNQEILLLITEYLLIHKCVCVFLPVDPSRLKFELTKKYI
uniref:Galectin n=1 Tax=Takifugu rubripes TaxID=31033 RepID=A0A674N0B1_TAKRU